MARLVPHAKLDSRTARAKLQDSKEHGDVYWVPVERGLALGYYKPREALPGTWYLRRKIGSKQLKRVLGLADDYADADGIKVLDYGQAQRAAIAGERTATVRATEGGFTVGDALDLWFDHYSAAARSPSAVRETRHKVNLVRKALGERKVIYLKAAEIKDWMNGIASAGRTVRGQGNERKQVTPGPDDEPREVKRRRQSTANRLLAQLKAALNHAWHEKKVSSDTEWRRVRPFKGADQPRAVHLTEREARALVKAADENFRPLVLAALLTGCRWSELREMRVGHFSRSAGTIAVLHTKGGHDRQVPLTDEGRSFFSKQVSGRPSSDFMFKREDGSQWGAQDQKRRMAAVCKKAKVVPAVGFHALRHTYGSLLAMEDVPMHVIAKAMGHRDTRMTERHYAHLAPGYVSEAIRNNLPTFGRKNRGATSRRQ